MYEWMDEKDEMNEWKNEWTNEWIIEKKKGRTKLLNCQKTVKSH